MMLNLILTQQCNLSCSYCPVLKKQGFIAEETAFKAVDLYLKTKEREKKIKIFGGEPLLNIPLLKEIISRVREKDSSIKIDLTTNGVFLDSGFLSYLRKNKVDLAVSVDGDFKTQAKNKKGTTPKTYRDIFRVLKPYLKGTVFNMVIAPNNVADFLKNFNYLFQAGARRFNLLPAAYMIWKDEDISVLRRQLNALAFFLKNNESVYMKNFDRNEKLFLLNTGITVDANGDIFLSDAVLLKQFQKMRKHLRVNNINKIKSFGLFGKTYLRKKAQETEQLIKKSTGSAVWKSNEKVSSAMNDFAADVKKGDTTKKVLDIKIGYQCNNRCFFCAQGHKRDKCTFRDKEEIKKELKDTRAGRSSVVFTGGEPTVHPDFLHLVGYARELDYKSIQIQTNGRMFGYKKFCLDAIRIGGGSAVIEFSPSLHGHKAELHDYLTCAPGSFDQTVQGIKNLKALGQRVITNSVINSANYRHLPDLAKLLVKLGVDQFQFAFVHIVGTARENKKWIVPKKSDAMPYVKKGLEIGKKAGKKVTTEAIPYCLMQGYEDCVAEQIIPDGKVIEKNLIVESFADYRRNFGKVKTKKCQKCAYFHICEGPWREYPELFGWSEFKPR